MVHAAAAPGAGHDAQGPQPARSHVSQRIAERVDPQKDDAHHRLNLLADSKLDKEGSSTGPICFSPRICSEPFPPKFALPRDIPKYTGAVKPEDWLSDYGITIDIMGGNKEVGGTLCAAHASRVCKDIAKQPTGSIDQLLF
jgi:hypothetical protein